VGPSLRLGDLEGTPFGDYLQSVHRFDADFGNFIDELSRAGLLDNTVVALYGDHQAFIAKEPEAGRVLGYAPTDHFAKFVAARRLPFLIRLPGGQHAGSWDTPAGHLDVAPTIASLFAMQVPSTMLGRDLTQGGDGLVVFRDGSFLNRTRLSLNGFTPSTDGCYEFATGVPTGCQGTETARLETTTLLQLSDRLLAGNLIRRLAGPTHTPRPRSTGEGLAGGESD
jgi:phosphoglycerol transferase MdoB-like AlkP superfamily enzyme